MRSNKIADLAPLAGFTDLSLLMLDANEIKDLGPFLKAVAADAQGAKRFAPYLRVSVAGNPVDAKQLDALKALGVRLIP